jgi:hypothetical protein
MPDWRELVRQRLGGIDLAENEAAEVVEELANHLEETYRTHLGQGVTEQAAMQLALQEAGDWGKMRRQIESSRKKELPMNKRVSQFWLPALLTIFLAMVFLMVIEEVGPKPWVSSAQPLRMTPVAVVYFAWLLTLPFVGALGAYLSRRAGARPSVVFSSVIFPIFPYLAFFVIGLPIAVILDDHVAHNIMLPAFFVGFAAWVILPGIALLAGGLLAQCFSKCLSARRAANT